ncbi:MAG: hypothetical protein ABR501_09510 [Pyrinomonadaceae bacterium]
MLTNTFRAITIATRSVFKNWQSTLLIAIVYASLLLILYSFVIVKEATLLQVSITFAVAIAAPLLFFILQTMIASTPTAATAGSLLRRSLANFWKLLLISLPLIAIAILVAYLLAKIQSRLSATVPDAAAQLPRRIATAATARDRPRPIDWRGVALSTLRYLAFGLVLPLAAIHLWLTTAREGLGAAVRKVKTLVLRSFLPQSVLIYIAGFLIFAVAPYLLLFRTTPTKHAWLEISLLVARLAIVFALTLFGWLITVRALSLSSTEPANHTPHEVV